MKVQMQADKATAGRVQGEAGTVRVRQVNRVDRIAALVKNNWLTSLKTYLAAYYVLLIPQNVLLMCIISCLS